jgi:hypothetical protein
VCRCSNREWLNGDGCFPLDPDKLYDRLNRVTYYREGPVDAFWHYLVDFDPKEMLAMRLRQKVYLARYARISPEFWEHRELNELREYYEATGNLVQRENDPTRRET